jgi:hypothetical protein
MDGETLVALCQYEPNELITIYGRQIHPQSILHYPENQRVIQADVLLATLELGANKVDVGVYRCPCGNHNIVPDPQMTTVQNGKLWDIRCWRKR